MTSSLFATTVLASFLVVALPHILPCPAPRRAYADEGDMAMQQQQGQQQNGGVVRRVRRRSSRGEVSSSSRGGAEERLGGMRGIQRGHGYGRGYTLGGHLHGSGHDSEYEAIFAVPDGIPARTPEGHPMARMSSTFWRKWTSLGHGADKGNTRMFHSFHAHSSAVSESAVCEGGNPRNRNHFTSNNSKATS
ncbi:hypothetical protein CHGG_04726 [Chaetomium globosum CBS 148.51]|uniref:Secreted protein n=1 Tax=Chaetomium globosum (strain ATCC 6205 / CBS 148.51 / DSM 1962 / NBRC 6347 / NRRL 1970) TaxID=306901 RepID=Q2H0H0_CHAGB|nr:uncharacterized protein CHGG_04726 [Chaetomium globosum CBS 148.51]EAQ88107.1 hypothetical protein CHGG_04726 [Chaetomium globosum CBS 148.51]